jgi:Alpha/beta hydrolase family
MATYALIHGAGDGGWYWHLLEAELRGRGHDVVAPDLPSDDDAAGLPEYADTVVEAVGDRTGLVVVAQSYGGFTAPLVCDRLPGDLLVLLAAMVPRSGERPDDWWANTGYAQARREHDERNGAPADDVALFFHDVPPELAAEAMRRGRDQSATPGSQPWPLPAWPDVPTRFLLCRDDRFFPADFLRRVVQDRLAITPDDIDGGHCVALSRPRELADRLESFRVGL